MRTEDVRGFREINSSLAVLWLRSEGWARDASASHGALNHYVRGAQRVVLPVPQAADFLRRMAETVDDLAAVHGMTAQDVVEDMRSDTAVMLRVWALARGASVEAQRRGLWRVTMADTQRAADGVVFAARDDYTQRREGHTATTEHRVTLYADVADDLEERGITDDGPLMRLCAAHGVNFDGERISAVCTRGSFRRAVDVLLGALREASDLIARG